MATSFAVADTLLPNVLLTFVIFFKGERCKKHAAAIVATPAATVVVACVVVILPIVVLVFCIVGVCVLGFFVVAVFNYFVAIFVVTVVVVDIVGVAVSSSVRRTFFGGAVAPESLA